MAMTRAYILVETAAGSSSSVVTALKGVPGLVMVYRVTGPYDIIAMIETEDLGSVGHTVTEHVHTISGIVRTVTCLAIK